MRSASSLAFFSASSKLMVSPASFFAPSLPFFAPNTPLLRGPVVPLLVRSAEDVVVRGAVGAVGAVDSVAVPVSGDLDRAIPFPAAPLPAAWGLSGDAVLPMTGGVAVRDGGGVGRLMAGLSQDEKKSSSLSGVAATSSAPSTTTSSGCLHATNTCEWSLAGRMQR